MLPLKQQVTSLELSKRLCELGVKQESLFYYCCFENGEADIFYECEQRLVPPSLCSAFTASELLELLPKELNYDQLTIRNEEDEFFVNYRDNELKYSYFYTSNDNNICNSLAKMLIHILENNLLENK